MSQGVLRVGQRTTHALGVIDPDIESRHERVLCLIGMLIMQNSRFVSIMRELFCSVSCAVVEQGILFIALHSLVGACCGIQVWASYCKDLRITSQEGL